MAEGRSATKQDDSSEIVDFASLGLLRTKHGYRDLGSLTGETIVVKTLAKEKPDGTPAGRDGRGIYVATLDDGRKFLVSEGKAKQLEAALTLAKGKMVRCLIEANARRGFRIS